jgi:hypothetical protein
MGRGRGQRWLPTWLVHCHSQHVCCAETPFVGPLHTLGPVSGMLPPIGSSLSCQLCPCVQFHAESPLQACMSVLPTPTLPLELAHGESDWPLSIHTLGQLKWVLCE